MQRVILRRLAPDQTHPKLAEVCRFLSNMEYLSRSKFICKRLSYTHPTPISLFHVADPRWRLICSHNHVKDPRWRLFCSHYHLKDARWRLIRSQHHVKGPRWRLIRSHYHVTDPRWRLIRSHYYHVKDSRWRLLCTWNT